MTGLVEQGAVWLSGNDNRQAGKRTDGQAGRQAGKQTDKQAGRQTDRQAGRKLSLIHI